MEEIVEMKEHVFAAQEDGNLGEADFVKVLGKVWNYAR